MKQKFLNLYFYFFGLLAKNFIKKYKPFVIGITGSIGKTSARMIIFEILQKNFNDKIVYTSDKNFNGELGLSLSILGIGSYNPNFFGILKTILIGIKISLFGKKIYDIIILEYGIDHVGEMDFLLSIVKPNIGIITKIDKVHSSQFENKELIAKEKYKLLINSKQIVFLNYDDEFALKYKNEITCKKYFYSTNIELNNLEINLKGKNYDLKFENNEIVSSFDFYFDENKKFNISSNLIGQENIGYISIGFCILEELISFKNKNIKLEFNLQYSRFSKFDGINNSILIDSSYNGAPESMKKVIDNFLRLKEKILTNYEIIFCLGEMRELGQYTKEEHEKLANYVKNKSENIFIVGKSMEEYFLPITKNAKYFKNSKLLGEYLKNFLNESKKKYLILFKGSQNTIFMEEALKQVMKNDFDKAKICRQEDFWLEKKNIFFKS